MTKLNWAMAGSLMLVSSMSFASVSVEGLSGEAEKTFREKATMVPKIERIIEFDAQKIRAIRSADGRTMYMVDNGRFVLVGDMFDMWQKKRLKTMDDLADAVRKIDLEGVGFEVEESNKFSLGKGKNRVVVFVDPLCAWCHKLIEEVVADEKLLAEYAFDFIVIPVLGPQSERLAQRFACTTERDPKNLAEAFMKKQEGIEALPVLEKCDGVKYRETKRSAEILGINSAPLVIAPDGRYARGKPLSLIAFLKGSSSDGGTDLHVSQEKKPIKIEPDKAKEIEKAVKDRLKAQAATQSTAPSKN